MSIALFWNALSCVFLAVALLVLIWALHRRRQHGLFRRHGIPGPEPELFWGNWKQLKRDRLQVLQQWIDKYGKVFGFFMAEKPFMVVTDLDLIQHCFLKEASTFQDRPVYMADVEPFTSSLLLLKGQGWKKVRKVLSHSFTASKVKLCSEIVSGCTRELLAVLKTHRERCEVVDVFEVAQGMSLDVMTKASLAWKVNCQRKTDDPLLLGVKSILEKLDSTAVESTLAMPGIRTLLKHLYPLTRLSHINKQIFENVRGTVELRRQGLSPRQNDVLQMMLDAQAGIDDESYDARKKGLLIEDRHLISNSTILLLAGFETTAVTLGFTLYLLAMHPEEQEKVHAEMKELFPDSNELSYDDVHRLKRLETVIRETLRLYPPVPHLVMRICPRDTTAMGQFIPAGTTLVAPAWHIHRNKEYWPEPSRFLPARFGQDHPDRHPLTFFPFGLGPKTCIGRRLALFEIKMAVCGILRKYRLVPCKETQDPVPLAVPSLTLRPDCGLKLRLETRQR